jgi:A/G-specific adenine glycosylase
LQLRQSLLAWYDENHRILPWRRNPHSRLSESAIAKAAAEGSKPAPQDLGTNDFIYYVWVCEIMSQQTQVSRAAEYFRKWIAKWPNVASLASATQEEVNEAWAGLGYYRRARYLLDGAKYIVNDLGGVFPATAKELSKIPGVGAYTSNAIASIACGERVAVVDGNVIRVLARLRRLKGDPRSSAMTKLFAELASQALDPERPGDFNQAVMELGATVCVPNTTPSCESCPVCTWCKAYKAEKHYKTNGGVAVSVTEYPTKVEKAEKREELVAVAVVRVIPSDAGQPDGFQRKEGNSDKFVLLRRPQGGLLAGLLEFPMITIKEKSERHDAMNKFLQDVLGVNVTASESIGGDNRITVLERKDIGETVHTFSHIRMTMCAEKIVIRGPSWLFGGIQRANSLQTETKNDEKMPHEDARQTSWYSAEELESKGLSSGVKKVYKMYLNDQSKEKMVKTQGIQRFFKPVGR